MRTPRRLLLSLHTDERFRPRLERAAAGNFALRPLGSWGELRRIFPACPANTVVLVDPYDPAPEGEAQISRDLAAFLTHFPSAVVVAAFWLRQGTYRDTWSLSRLGVTELLILDEENTEETIRRRLAAVRTRPVRRLIEGLRLPMPGRAHAILTAAADVVAAGGQVGDFARLLSMTHRTLYRWCLRCQLPAPKELLRWLRGLYAAAMLDDPGQSVIGVARACGYTDDRGLQRLFRDLVEQTPTVLRERGAFPVLESAFHDELRTLRARRSDERLAEVV